MNHVQASAALYGTGVPEGFDQFESALAALRQQVEEGGLSLPFAIGGITSILHGGLMTRDFPVWMTVKEPTFRKNPPRAWYHYEAILAETKQAFAVDTSWFRREVFWKRDISIYDCDHSRDVDELSFVRVTGKDLGFDDRAIHASRFYARAEELGLKLCPLRFALYLRAAYTSQPCGEWLRIATPTLYDHEVRRCFVRIGHGVGEGLHIDAPMWDIHPHIKSTDEVVFVR